MHLARVYDEPQDGDGLRVLVDRLWPRGVRKDDPRIDRWLKDIAPSTELRRWYGHRAELAEEFAKRYREELASGEQAAALEELRALAEAGPLTLMTATKEVRLSHLEVLRQVVAETAEE